MPGSLDSYRRKRDFSRTPEPAGDGAAPPEGPVRFVIQEHHATALHWDFRLEHAGVLASWALPKGLPVDPKANHLAVRTEDHPLAYLDFEGVIPEGEYGGGRVYLWDQGTYEAEKFRDDEVMVRLHGNRASGRYVLFRTDGKNWMIHRMDPPVDATREPMPARLQPMLAKLSRLPREDGGWAYEVKWDGIRAIYYASAGRVRIESRNLLDVTAQYPELRALADSLASHDFVLDGEIVAFDASGRPSFGKLQSRMGLKSAATVKRRMGDVPVVYVIFDLLYFDGHSTMGLPYRERRRLLEALDLNGPSWRTPAYHEEDGAALIEASIAQGLEGILAKRLDSPYEPGKRSLNWRKVKNKQEQEVVIGGWMRGEGAREGTFGAILAGVYDRARGDAEAAGAVQRLRYVGRVGSGFTDEMLQRLAGALAPLRRESSPFDEGRPDKGATFVEPHLVAVVEFSEWTSDGLLRHPVFKGIRDDKHPRDVIREEIVSEP